MGDPRIWSRMTNPSNPGVPASPPATGKEECGLYWQNPFKTKRGPCLRPKGHAGGCEDDRATACPNIHCEDGKIRETVEVGCATCQSVPASPRETPEPPPIYGKQLRAESPAPAAPGVELDFEKALICDPGMGGFIYSKAELNAQVRALIDAAVSKAREEERAMALSASREMADERELKVRAEYTPLLALVREVATMCTIPNAPTPGELEESARQLLASLSPLDPRD